jgi:hypothetical protein
MKDRVRHKIKCGSGDKVSRGYTVYCSETTFFSNVQKFLLSF